MIDMRIHEAGHYPFPDRLPILNFTRFSASSLSAPVDFRTVPGTLAPLGNSEAERLVSGSFHPCSGTPPEGAFSCVEIFIFPRNSLLGTAYAAPLGTSILLTSNAITVHVMHTHFPAR